MAQAPKGKADYLLLGDWNATCFECGMKFKASTLKKHWQGYWVCAKHWEPRHPQDFVKGVADNQSAPWVQPMPTDAFVSFTALYPPSGVAGYAVAGIAVAGKTLPPGF